MTSISISPSSSRNSSPHRSLSPSSISMSSSGCIHLSQVSTSTHSLVTFSSGTLGFSSSTYFDPASYSSSLALKGSVVSIGRHISTVRVRMRVSFSGVTFWILSFRFTTFGSSRFESSGNVNVRGINNFHTFSSSSSFNRNRDFSNNNLSFDHRYRNRYWVRNRVSSNIRSL